MVSQVLIYFLRACGHFIYWIEAADPSSIYVDDVALVVGGVHTLPKLIQDINYCGEFTDLQLNLNKCVYYDPSTSQDHTVASVRVTSDPVKYLGIFVGVSKDLHIHNFEGPLRKMKEKAKQWHSRFVSLEGCVLVAKVLLLSCSKLYFCFIGST